VQEFGKVRAGHDLDCRFEFRNTGTAPLRIRHVRTTCGCVVAAAPTEAVAPGDSAWLDVQVSTRGQREPTELHKALTVCFDAPDVDPVILEISAQIRPAVAVRPETAWFTGQPGERVDVTLHREMLSADDFATLRVRESPPYVEASWLRRDGDDATLQLALDANRAPQELRALCLSYRDGDRERDLTLPLERSMPPAPFRLRPGRWFQVLRSENVTTGIVAATRQRFSIDASQAQFRIRSVSVESNTPRPESIAWEIDNGADPAACSVWLVRSPVERIFRATLWVECEDLASGVTARVPLDVCIFSQLPAAVDVERVEAPAECDG
jgi:hypothetical protein